MKWGQNNMRNPITKKIRAICNRIKQKKMISWEYAKFRDARRVSIYSKVKLTEQEKTQIDNVFRNHYGKKIPYIWHKYYTAYTGKFDPYYFPELLFIPKFEYYLNCNQEYISVFEDKNIISLLANGVGIQTPKVIISCCNGVLRDEKSEIVSWDDITGIIPQGVFFAKPTVDSGSGKNCTLIDTTKDDAIGKLKKLGNNFVLQERIICSDSIRKIYSGSVNTFRIMTYYLNGELYYVPPIMRIGKNGSFVDNAHAGGVFIAINKDGTLHEKAFTEFREEFYEHPNSHLVFKGYRIENFERVIQAALKMHSSLPQLGVINWDFTIDKNENPILVEANTVGGSIWLFQMAWGCGAFGENTISVLEMIKRKDKECVSKFFQK